MKASILRIACTTLLSISLVSCDEILGVADSPSGSSTTPSTVDDSEIIQFKDSYAEGLLVQYFDKNGDYKLSKAEAAAVIDLRSIFKDNEYVEHLDELKYFTRLKVISKEAFNGAKNLKSITIPQSVEIIDQSAFVFCKSLKNIVIENGVKKIASSAFRGCTALESISIPASVNDISHSAFSDCENLKKIIVAPSNSVYDSREECNCIIETSSDKVIEDCMGSFLPTSITAIGVGAFSNRDDISEVVIHEGVTDIESDAYAYCHNLRKVELPSTIQHLGSCAFYRYVSEVTIKATTPPTIEERVFHDIRNDRPSVDRFVIYVPANSLESYKTAEGWDQYADYIKAI